MKPALVSQEKCTGCGACKERCPQKCMEFIVDECGNRYPGIDESRCVECGLCTKVCPANAIVDYLKPSMFAYAGWSTNETIRRNSASGGIASSLYRYLMTEGYICYGVVWDDNFNLNYRSIRSEEDLKLFQNSKYTFSDISSVLSEIEGNLKKKEKVFIVGLPCQISGLKAYLCRDYDNLLTADLLCHGVCSSEYLSQHIKYVDKKLKQKCERVSFRDPEFDTENYHFTLRNSDAVPFYDKTVESDDVYQMGYHKAIIYRENCYHCAYAAQKRVGDITLGDYWRIGHKIPFEYPKKKISLILVQTQKGEDVIRKAEKVKQIVLVERPVEESAEVQGQLNQPCNKTVEHEKFIRKYRKSKDFESAARSAMRVWIFCNQHGMGKIYEKSRRLRFKLFHR
ncbi:MAG: Coenzyme F420 hydrogenase/dehydrogenase, beta subunit C-terminal domain [Eubacteriales bacterium]